MKYLLVLTLLLNTLPGFAYTETQNIGIIYTSPLERGIGGLVHMKQKSKMRAFIKTCNRPDLEVIDPQEAMRIIISKNIMCTGPSTKTHKITKK